MSYTREAFDKMLAEEYPCGNEHDGSTCKGVRGHAGPHMNGDGNTWNNATSDPLLVDEQAAPVLNTSRPIWEHVIEDMQARDNVGRQRYGTPLQAHNGRDALTDVYQELLDAVVYIRQEIEERRERRTRGLSWICIVCGIEHPSDHEGIYLGQWMACCGCERELARRQLGVTP